MRPLRYMVYVIVVSLPLWAYIPTQELINGYRGFEPNYGQVQDFEGKPVKDIIFSTKAPGLHLFFKKDGVSYVIYSKTEGELNSFEGFDLKERLNKEDCSPLNYARVDLELVGGNIDRSKIVFEDELPGYVNYYLPGCPEGITNLKSYRVVRVKDVYPCIDWVFRYDADGNLHHEFVVKPEGNPDEIKIKVKWADVKLRDDGSEIILSTPVGDILDGSIYAYEGDKRVKVNYVFDGGLLAYDVRGWSRNENLVIDPPLARLWATYYGGSDYDYAYSVATDQQGNVYVVGYTWSSNFPVYDPGGGAYYQGNNAGYYDAFILKFNSSGVRLWATYYGGSSSSDYAYSVATDQQGNVYVVGYTSSTNFPVYDPGGGAYYQGSRAGYDDAFILKFDSSGVRQWATYYGGSSSSDYAYSVATDQQGNVYVVGYTSSTNFPVYDPGGGAYYQGNNAGYYDAFILKFNSSGVRQWATYYGGSSSSDYAYSVATDPQGNVYVVGYTRSTDFPVYNPGGGAYYQGSRAGYDDAFILKFDSSGVRQWATYYGGSSSSDYAYSVATDPQGNVYVVGYTSSTNFPVYDPGGGAYFQQTIGSSGYSDAFILKFNSSGVRLWATYYGGSSYDYTNSVATDPQGNVYVVGNTYSTDFPVYNPGGGAYYQGSEAGYDDAFILKFNSSGVRLWATYYGGSSSDYAYSVATDPQGNVYVVGNTGSTNFPVGNPYGAYYQQNNNGSSDAFLLKFMTDAGPTLVYPGPLQIINTSPVNFVWKTFNIFGSYNRYQLQISTNSNFDPSYTYLTTDTSYSVNLSDGNYYWRVRAVASDNSDSTYWTVSLFELDKTPPTVPNLVSPGNGAALNTSSVTLIWNRSQDNLSGVGQYEIQLANNPSFTNPITYLTSDTTNSISNLNDGTYYWRVRAEDNAGNLSGWSEVWSYEIDMTAPNTPYLVTPVGGYLRNTAVTFIWTSVSKLTKFTAKPAPVVYDFYIDTTSSFATAIDTTVQETTLTLTLPEGRYYWKVRARDLAGNIGDFSTNASFVLDIAPPVMESTTVWHDTTYMGPFDISTRIADNLAGVKVVKLFYKRSTDSSWVEVVMNYNSGSGRYEGQIPAVSQTGDSVYYYVWASDSAGNEATDPANAPGNCYRFRVITTSVNDVVTKPDIKVFTKGSLIVMSISSPQPTEVKLSIYDITGRPTYGPITKNISSGLTKLEVQVPRAGIYFYEVETPLMKDRGKVVIVR